MKDRLKSYLVATLAVGTSLLLPGTGIAAPAAQVDFAVGNVTAMGPNGQSRALGKGAQIEQGDTVNTNGGRAQLRFTDGAYVSLQPESQFRIDQYRYDGKQDGNEKGFFSLLKGGLRTITGLVGRSNKQNYQVTTSVATIGIRGTEYTIQYGSSVTGTVGEGQIEVCNGAGCLSVTNGESYYVQGQEVKPVLTNKRTDLPPPEPTQPPTNFAQGENKDAAGNPMPGFLLTGTPPALNFALTYPGQSGGQQLLLDALILDSGAATSVNTFNSGEVTAVTLDAAGVLRSFSECADGCGVLRTVIWNGPVLDSGNDGIIAWGRWTGGTTEGDADPIDLNNGRSFHYVVGLPTSADDLSMLQTGNFVGTYVLLGATSPTTTDGAASGRFSGGTLTADFLNGQVSTTFALVFGSTTYNATGQGSILGSTFEGRVSASSVQDSACLSGCGGALAGFFAGPKAIRAGMTYDISGTSIGTIQGAAAFAQSSLTPTAVPGQISTDLRKAP